MRTFGIILGAVGTIFVIFIKILGVIWAGIGGIGWISSCYNWFESGKIGDHAANYAASETFLIRIIVYFFIFILPGLILIRMGRKKDGSK